MRLKIYPENAIKKYETGKDIENKQDERLRSAHLGNNIAKFHDMVLEKSQLFLSDNTTPDKKFDDLVIFALLSSLVKSYRLFKGINLLCKNDLEQESKILFRSLFEAYLLIEYVADAPNDITRAEDCAIRGIIADKKRENEIDSLNITRKASAFLKKTETEADKSEQLRKRSVNIINANYDGAIERLRKRHPDEAGLTNCQIADKYKMDFVDLVKIINRKYKTQSCDLIQEYYAIIIRDCAKSVHCNELIGENVNLDDDSGKWEIFLKSKETSRDTILSASANIFIAIMEITNRLLDFQKEVLLTDLRNRYKEVS